MGSFSESESIKYYSKSDYSDRRDMKGFKTLGRFLSKWFLVVALITPFAVFDLLAKEVTADELGSDWSFYGKGVKTVERGMFYMKEDTDSLGVMIISPEAYDSDVVVTYQIMPMNAASVCVVILSATDAENPESFTIPAGYDGSAGIWTRNISNYFFAFNNAAHNRVPFLRRFTDRTLLGEYESNVMVSGRFNKVQAGREGNKIWLKINDEKLIEVVDENPLGGGHIAFRIRGLSQEPAACLIRNVVITEGVN